MQDNMWEVPDRVAVTIDVLQRELDRGQKTWAPVPFTSSVTLSNSPDLSEVHFPNF